MTTQKNNYNYQIIKEECKKVIKEDNFPELKNKNILILGANGLIGAFLADFFIFLNDSLNYNIKLTLSSYSELSNAERLSHISTHPDIKYFSWDCSKDLNHSLLPENIDMVFFCSGYGQPSKFLQDNIKTTLLNINGVNNLLSHLQESNKITKFLFLSTSEIYGNALEYPTTENYPCSFDLNNNRISYILSKATAENLCMQYNKLENLDVKIARIALAYGPGTKRNDNRVMQEFIFKASNDGKIRMIDSGSAIRNYLYITDCVEIMLNILLRGKSEVYNIGGDTQEISIHDLACQVANIFEAKVEKGAEENKNIKSAPKKVGLSMLKYRQEFKEYGKNIVKLEEGLKKVTQWYNLHSVNRDTEKQ